MIENKRYKNKWDNFSNWKKKNYDSDSIYVYKNYGKSKMQGWQAKF